MMRAKAFAGMNVQAHLDALGLTHAHAARILCVSERTLRRYVKDAVPAGPLLQCLLAWQILKDAGLPWPGAGSRSYTRQDDGLFVHVSKE
jgi:hypothetical protein